MCQYCKGHYLVVLVIDGKGCLQVKEVEGKKGGNNSKIEGKDGKEEKTARLKERRNI